MRSDLPSIPYPEFPLRPHRNGQWCKSVWNAHSHRSEIKYFGAWHDDPKGERALHDPATGWLTRRTAIKAGTDHLRLIASVDSTALTLGELMGRFLQFNKRKVDAGDLSLRTLNDYLCELPKFVTFFGPQTPVSGMLAEHFSAYMTHLVSVRKLGRYARRRVRVNINVMLNYGTKNGWMQKPPTGSDWVAPAIDPESMRVARMRSGKPDLQKRIFTGDEIDQLLSIATPAWKAMILIAVNCGLGPADVGRLRWKNLSMTTGRLDYPRGKTGVARVGYLWKKTRRQLELVRNLKRTRAAVEKDGDEALVFLSELGKPAIAAAAAAARPDVRAWALPPAAIALLTAAALLCSPALPAHP
jgi:integrase